VKLLPDFLRFRPRTTPQSPPNRITVGDLAALFADAVSAEQTHPVEDDFVIHEPALAPGPCAANCGRLVMRMRMRGNDFLLTACPPCAAASRGMIIVSRPR
jgi:hypothetical protein